MLQGAQKLVGWWLRALRQAYKNDGARHETFSFLGFLRPKEGWLEGVGMSDQVLPFEAMNMLLGPMPKWWGTTWCQKVWGRSYPSMTITMCPGGKANPGCQVPLKGECCTVGHSWTQLDRGISVAFVTKYWSTDGQSAGDVGAGEMSIFLFLFVGFPHMADPEGLCVATDGSSKLVRLDFWKFVSLKSLHRSFRLVESIRSFPHCSGRAWRFGARTSCWSDARTTCIVGRHGDSFAEKCGAYFCSWKTWTSTALSHGYQMWIDMAQIECHFVSAMLAPNAKVSQRQEAEGTLLMNEADADLYWLRCHWNLWMLLFERISLGLSPYLRTWPSLWDSCKPIQIFAVCDTMNLLWKLFCFRFSDNKYYGQPV